MYQIEFKEGIKVSLDPDLAAFASANAGFYGLTVGVGKTIKYLAGSPGKTRSQDAGDYLEAIAPVVGGGSVVLFAFLSSEVVANNWLYFVFEAALLIIGSLGFAKLRKRRRERPEVVYTGEE